MLEICIPLPIMSKRRISLKEKTDWLIDFISRSLCVILCMWVSVFSMIIEHQ